MMKLCLFFFLFFVLKFRCLNSEVVVLKGKLFDDGYRNTWSTQPRCISCLQAISKTYFENVQILTPECAEYYISEFSNVESSYYFGLSDICVHQYADEFVNKYESLKYYGDEILDSFKICLEDELTDSKKEALRDFEEVFKEGRKKCKMESYLEEELLEFSKLYAPPGAPPVQPSAEQGDSSPKPQLHIEGDTTLDNAEGNKSVAPNSTPQGSSNHEQTDTATKEPPKPDRADDQSASDQKSAQTGLPLETPQQVSPPVPVTLESQSPQIPPQKSESKNVLDSEKQTELKPIQRNPSEDILKPEAKNLSTSPKNEVNNASDQEHHVDLKPDQNKPPEDTSKPESQNLPATSLPNNGPKNVEPKFNRNASPEDASKSPSDPQQVSNPNTPNGDQSKVNQNNSELQNSPKPRLEAGSEKTTESVAADSKITENNASNTDNPQLDSKSDPIPQNVSDSGTQNDSQSKSVQNSSTSGNTPEPKPEDKSKNTVSTDAKMVDNQSKTDKLAANSSDISQKDQQQHASDTIVIPSNDLSTSKLPSNAPLKEVPEPEKPEGTSSSQPNDSSPNVTSLSSENQPKKLESKDTTTIPSTTNFADSPVSRGTGGSAVPTP